VSNVRDLPKAELAALCEKHHIRELPIFGPAASDELRPESDSDLLVHLEPDARIGFMELGAMEQDFERVFGRPVDVVPKVGLRPILRDEILGSAQLLYAAA